MGRRLNTSRPTVIQTMLTPLSDSFAIQPSDILEQWYYVNTGAYSPDRQSTPLQLKPTIVAVDTSTETIYHPSFASVVWYYFDPSNNTDYSATDDFWPGLHWVRITAVEAETGGVLNDYYCPTTGNPDFKLYVQKNVTPPTVGDGNAGQNLCCVATYIDPRDSGVTVEVKETVLLATNKDATSGSLKINLLAPTKTIFNVLSGGSSVYNFVAQVLNDNNDDVTEDYYIEWYGKVDNERTEHLINTLYCYTQATQVTDKGQGKDTITIDAMYVEHLDIVCRLRKTSSSALLPSVAHCSLVWEFPQIDPHTVCKNGRVVNASNREMTFTNIINYRGGVISDAQRIANFLFNYKRRISTSSSYTDMGWGDEITVQSNSLRQTTSYSTPVHAEVYMLGAYSASQDDDTFDGTGTYAVVTDDGDVVFDRL